MTSYVIWVVVRVGKYLSLNKEGKLGEEPRQNKVWEHYTQLLITQAKFHFKRINDIFLYAVICKLTGDVGYRISPEAMKIIKEWGCWFLQNQLSTHIRVSGLLEGLSSFLGFVVTK